MNGAQKIQIAFLLDVDGVVTDPIQKKVTEPKIFDYLSEILKSDIITLNTGRSNDWMIDRVINPLANRLKDKSLLQNFFAVGEKGLTWISFNPQGKLMQGVFDTNGQRVEGFDLSVFLDSKTVDHFKTLESESRRLIEERYSHSTFFDSSKKAMISTEMIDGHIQPEFASEQDEFVKALHHILNKLNLTGKFKIDPTTIATDIQVPYAGKHLGAKRILGWLDSKKITPKKYIAVGDSYSDLEMADELKSQGKNYQFIYVNPKRPPEGNLINISNGQPRYNFSISKKEFSKGLLEVFESIS